MNSVSSRYYFPGYVAITVVIQLPIPPNNSIQCLLLFLSDICVHINNWCIIIIIYNTCRLIKKRGVPKGMPLCKAKTCSVVIAYLRRRRNRPPRPSRLIVIGSGVW